MYSRVNHFGVSITKRVLGVIFISLFVILKSPQDLKYHLSEYIIHELFFSKLLKIVQSIKNIVTIQDSVDYFAS
jgi:hypothetical protein